MNIQRLPKKVQSCLQSGVVIPDTTQCILELVHNSLDAGATTISVAVDLEKHNIIVLDNGTGITRSDLNMLGKRYMTSKCKDIEDLNQPIPTYGYRGESICSLVSMCSKLAITTKTEKENITVKKEFINGIGQEVHISKNNLPHFGTSVNINNFMSTMPVRQKRVNPTIDTTYIKKELNHLAIINSHVTFSLRDNSKGVVLLQTQKHNSNLSSFASFLQVASSLLLPVDYQSAKYKISGFLSQETHSKKDFQFVYVNKRIIHKTEIHRLVNDLIKKYRKKRQQLPLGKNEIFIPNVAKHNIFLIEINCPYREYDIFNNLRKPKVQFRNLEEVSKTVRKAVKKAFKAEETPAVVALKISDLKEGKKKNFGVSNIVGAVRGVVAKRKLESAKPTVPKKAKKDEFCFKTPEIPKRPAGLSESIFSSEPEPVKNPTPFVKPESFSFLQNPKPVNEFLNISPSPVNESPFRFPDTPFNNSLVQPLASDLFSDKRQSASVPSAYDFFNWVCHKTRGGLKVLSLCKEFLGMKTNGIEPDFGQVNSFRIIRRRTKIVSRSEESEFRQVNNETRRSITLGNSLAETEVIESQKKTTPNVEPVKVFKDAAVQADISASPLKIDACSQVDSEKNIEFDAPQPVSKSKEGMKYFCTERFSFVPKGFSPSLAGSRPTLVPKVAALAGCYSAGSFDPALLDVKWEKDGVVNKPVIPNSIFTDLLEKTQGQMVLYESEILSINNSSRKIHELVTSLPSVNDLLSNVKVLGQFDNKFIVTLLALSVDKPAHLLTLFDQHAVDERVRLENLMLEFKSPDGKFRSHKAKHPISLPMSPSKIEILKEYDEKLLLFGISIAFFKLDYIVIDKIPNCFTDVNGKELANLNRLLDQLMGDIVDELLATRGSIQGVPKVIHNVICSQACRGAVKFNQPLTRAKMEEMIRNLRKCKFPLQCAHGRPTAIALYDLQDLPASVTHRQKPHLSTNLFKGMPSWYKE